MGALHILVVDDEPTLVSFLVPVLQRHGFTAESAPDGESALAVVQERRPDLVVLDVALPGMDGLAVCRRLRRGPAYLPVILLTGLGSRADELAGFAALADDYVVKPLSPDTLVARIHAVLRRTHGGDPGRRLVRFGANELDPAACEVRRDGRVVPLTRKEFALLVFLVEHAGQTFGPSQLLAQVWGADFTGSTATVTQHMHRLRLALEPDPSRPRHLLTRPGIGYRFSREPAG